MSTQVNGVNSHMGVHTNGQVHKTSNGNTESPYGFPGAKFKVAFFDFPKLEDFLEHSHYDGLYPNVHEILPKGHVKTPGVRPLPCDMHYTRDIPIKMRDGCTIYTDVFRPVTEEAVPAILPM